MKKNYHASIRYAPALICAVAGVCLSAPAVQAQAPPSAPLVTLTTAHSPVQKVLRTLFAEAGIRNFVIDADVQGTVNISLSAVSFPTALKQILGAVTPALDADVQDGIYHIRVAPNNFTKIGLFHYDAAMMAGLVTRPDGIIDVPPNFVIAVNSAGMPSSAPAGTAPMPGMPTNQGGPAVRGPVPAVNAILPDGVKRIFALQGDNSLVIKSAPSSFARLSMNTDQTESEGNNP